MGATRVDLGALLALRKALLGRHEVVVTLHCPHLRGGATANPTTGSVKRVPGPRRRPKFDNPKVSVESTQIPWPLGQGALKV